MPHDKNGREVKKGASVKFSAYDHSGENPGQRLFVGVVTAVFPSSETCNAAVCRPAFGGTVQETITLKEAELIIDEDGREPAQL